VPRDRHGTDAVSLAKEGLTPHAPTGKVMIKWEERSMIGPHEPLESKVLVRTLGAILHHARSFTRPSCRAWPDLLERWTEEEALPPWQVPPRPPGSRRALRADVVRRDDLAWGDSLFVSTKNSIYCINPAYRGWFVWGGWFDRHGPTPAIVGINGCTWGGSVLHSDILAAPGLFLEFANGVTTTRIRHVHVLRAPLHRA